MYYFPIKIDKTAMIAIEISRAIKDWAMPPITPQATNQTMPMPKLLTSMACHNKYPEPSHVPIDDSNITIVIMPTIFHRFS
ncbi:hypothetical protein CEW93_003570 [Moraxella sp. VT-16-12]|nr:hypothetical protein CEW93_003570 [Moraxella sp. VT-16-12]